MPPNRRWPGQGISGECASVDFEVAGHPRSGAGLRILADFVYGDDENLAGVFAFERGETLAGIEVYSLTGANAPMVLPGPEELRPLDDDAEDARASRVIDADEARIVRLLTQDVAATIGPGHDHMIRDHAARVRTLRHEPDDYVDKVVEGQG